MLRKFLLLLCLIAPVITLADSGYQIELIVLSNVNANTLNSEDWPSLTKDIINTANTVDLNIPSKTIRRVNMTDFILARQQQRLTQYSSYKTILHVAWRESLSQILRPTTIHIYGGRLFDDTGKTIKSVTDGSLPYSPTQHWEVNGTITVDLNHYFDANFILLFMLPTNQIAALTGGKAVYSGTFKYFQLMESLRTKSRELNYIDHPLYSVLFKIVPI